MSARHSKLAVAWPFYPALVAVDPFPGAPSRICDACEYEPPPPEPSGGGLLGHGTGDFDDSGRKGVAMPDTTTEALALAPYDGRGGVSVLATRRRQDDA